MKTAFVVTLLLAFAPVRQVQAQAVHLAVTGNTAGALTDCGCGEDPAGGLGRRLTVIDSLRKLYPGMLLFDTGDLLSSWQDPDNDSLLVALYARLGYDAIVPGEYEFTYGNRFTAQMERLPFVAANLPGYRPHKIFTANQPPVFVTGVLEPELFSYRSYEQRPAELLPVPASFAVPSQDTLVVVLFHGEEEGLRSLAEVLPAGSLILRGHWHRSFQPDGDALYQLGNVTVANPGAGGEYVLFLRREKTWQAQMIRLNSSIRTRPINELVR